MSFMCYFVSLKLMCYITPEQRKCRQFIDIYVLVRPLIAEFITIKEAETISWGCDCYFSDDFLVVNIKRDIIYSDVRFKGMR